MSETSGEKSFEPTQSRLDKARREGDFPRSSDVSAALAFGAGLGGVAATISSLALFARTSVLAATAHPFQGASSAVLYGIVLCALIPMACAAIAGTMASVLQSGGLRPVAITLKMSRLNPAEGFKRMLSREALVHAARALVAVACIVAATIPVVLQLLTAGAGAGTPRLAELAWSGALRCAFIVAAMGVLFGGVDFALVLAKWRKRLRMSLDEVKRDHKEHDGDPQAKARRRAMHRQISRSSLKRLKEAAFVIVNPTHIAIALEYRPPEVAVPRVLLRAADEAALRVREAALELKLPVIENVPLARALYAAAKAGDVIPKESYIAVAEVVAALSRSGVLAS